MVKAVDLCVRRLTCLLLLLGVVAGKGEAQNWTTFRGPNSSGIYDGPPPLIEWYVPEWVSIAWKTPIPGFGHSSPVVWLDRVFVTTAVSADSGASLGHAVNTGRTVANEGYVGIPEYQWGTGSWPILYKNLVIVHRDGRQDSFLAEFDRPPFVARAVTREAQQGQVRRSRDSLKNGTTIGAVVGAVALGTFGALLCNAQQEPGGPSCLGDTFRAAALGAAIGAGAGLAVDAALTRRAGVTVSVVMRF